MKNLPYWRICFTFSLFVFFGLSGTGFGAEKTHLTLSPFSKLCFELGEPVIINGTVQGPYVDLAIAIDTEKEAIAPSAAHVIAQSILKLPFTWVVPGDFAEIGTLRFWVAAYRRNHQRIDLATTNQIRIAKHCEPYQIMEVALPRVTNTEATISWQTNYPLGGQVSYGTTTFLGQLSEPVDTGVFKKEHSVVLRNLASDTEYYFTIRTIDDDPTAIISNVFKFRTEANPPSNGGVVISTKDLYVEGASTSSVVIAWTTDISGSSAIEYGPTIALQFSVEDVFATTTHRMQVTNLTLNRVYYFRVKSVANNIAAIGSLHRVFAGESFIGKPLKFDIIPPGMMNGNDVSKAMGYGEEDIKNTQRTLQLLGYFPRSQFPTGFWGPMSISAMKAFEKDFGLPMTGKLDTYESLSIADDARQLLEKAVYGKKNDIIFSLQELLGSLGFFPKDVGPNGYFGPLTKDAMARFQAFYHLPQTGVVAGKSLPLLRQMLQAFTAQ